MEGGVVVECPMICYNIKTEDTQCFSSHLLLHKEAVRGRRVQSSYVFSLFLPPRLVEILQGRGGKQKETCNHGLRDFLNNMGIPQAALSAQF